VTPTEAAALLTVAAAFDNRRPDPDAAKAWSVALGDLPFHDCRDAIVAHYRVSSDWLMPAMVIGEVRRTRAKRIAEVGDLTPPAGLSDAEERTWLGEARRRIGDGLEVHADHGELRARHLPDLRALLPKPTVHPSPTDQAPNAHEEATV
jgi:hypothetical protein